MFLKKLFFASASVLMLALAYHLGASTATAQAPGNPIANVAFVSWPGNGLVAMTTNGDSFFSSDNGVTWQQTGNVFAGGGPVPARTHSWGSLKVGQR